MKRILIYLFMLFSLISLSYAITEEQAQYNLNFATGVEYGMEVSVNETVYLTDIIRDNDDDSTKCSVWERTGVGTGNLLVNGTFTGNTCALDNYVELNTSANWYLMGADSTNLGYTAGGCVGNVTGYFTWVKGIDGSINTATESTRCRRIVGVTFSLSAPTGGGVTTNLSSVYATENLSLSISTNTGNNMNFSYSLDSASFISIANNTNLTSLTLQDQTVGSHTLNIKGVQNGVTYWNNATFEIQPYQYFRFYNGSDYLQDYTFGGESSIGDYVTLDTRELSFGSNNLTFTKTGYVNSLFNVNINNSVQYNKTYNVNISKIILNIYDIDTLNYITQLTEVSLISSNGYNGTTTTGKLNISDINFISEQYQIIAESSGYTTETIYFNYDNQQELIKNIYLINSSNSNAGTINIEVTADTGQLISGAICGVLQWIPSQNSYVSVSEGTTNSNGLVTLNILLNVNLYKFQCSKSGASVTSPSQIIATTGSTIPLVLNTGVTGVIPNYFESITYSFTNTSVNGTHQLLNFTFSDSNNLVNTGCINYYKKVGTKLTLLDSACSSTSSGTIYDIVRINNTYSTEAFAEITINNVATNLKSIIYGAIGNLADELSEYNLDILIPLAATILGMVIGLSLIPQNIFIAIISTIIMVWFSILLVPSVLSASVGLFITLIGVLMIYGGNK